MYMCGYHWCSVLNWTGGLFERSLNLELTLALSKRGGMWVPAAQTSGTRFDSRQLAIQCTGTASM